jgi:hypothetical protein
MKPNLPAIGRDATEHGWIKERIIHFTHLNTGRPLRRGSRPATAEEALPHAVGVAGATPGSRAAAKRTHVGFLSEQAGQLSQRDQPSTIFRRQRGRETPTWRSEAMETAMSSGRSAHRPAGAGAGESTISFPLLREYATEMARAALLSVCAAVLLNRG